MPDWKDFPRRMADRVGPSYIPANAYTWLSRYYAAPGAEPSRALPKDQVQNRAPLVQPEWAQAAMAINRCPQALMMTPTDWTGQPPELSLLQIKYDGIHVGFRVGFKPFAFTREGSDMECVSHCLPGLEAVERELANRFGGRHVLFGEYVHPAGFEGALADFRSGKGIGAIMLFDAVPTAVWDGRQPSPSNYERLVRLRHAWLRTNSRRVGVGFADTALLSGDQVDDIEVIAGAMWADGLEGLVVKDATAPYVRGASPHWQRLKRKETVDLPITRANSRPRDGRWWLKSITVTTKRGVECDIGVGFSEAQRQSPSDFRPGRIVELKHCGYTAKGALRSGSFVRFRDDKER